MSLHLSDVNSHNQRHDCWIIVHSKVFDMTDYVDLHPGGSSIILKYAGKDATAAYDEIHAPGIIEETLSADKFKGRLDPSEIPDPPENADAGWKMGPGEAEDRTPARRVERTVQACSKPDLVKIISIADFKEVAGHVLSPKAWAFYSSAATDLVTHEANADYYRQLMFRPRILRDVRKADTRTSILGFPVDAPFFISPAAMARLAHPDGECAMARGCGSEGLIQIISSNASYPLKAITGAGKPDQPFFFQLYVNTAREKTAALLRSAKGLGIKAIFVTVDAPVPGKREADERITSDNVSSGISGAIASNDKKGGGMGRLMGTYVDRNLTWADLPWIHEMSGLPLVIKGVQTAADARKAFNYAEDAGVRGLLLSNHGGRSLDTAPPALLTLLELHASCPEVFDKLEIYIDGGITRGTDILKALCLGATAVGLGRPFLYALCYGQEGIEHLSQILKDELETAMRLLGIEILERVGPEMLNTSRLDRWVVTQEDKHPWIRWSPRAKM